MYIWDIIRAELSRARGGVGEGRAEGVDCESVGVQSVVEDEIRGEELVVGYFTAFDVVAVQG